MTRDGAAILSGTGRRHVAEAAALDAIAGLDEPAAPGRRVWSRPADAPVAGDDVPTLGRRGGGRWLWIVLALAISGGLVWVVLTQKDLLRRHSAEYDRQKAEHAAELAAKEAQARQALPDPGAIKITSTPERAAVWLLLGRTPVDSLPLPTRMLHEVRVELDGHIARDVKVVAGAWTGTGQARRAELAVELGAGKPGKPLPAIPAKPTAAETAGFTDGRGVIHVTSTPGGAQAWLLVGITNEMNLAGIVAGRSYELRVQKDGYLPAFVSVTAEDWRDGGDPTVPLDEAAKRELIERAVVLERDPSARPR